MFWGAMYSISYTRRGNVQRVQGAYVEFAFEELDEIFYMYCTNYDILLFYIKGSLILEAILDFEPIKNILQPPFRFFLEKSDPVSPTSQKVLLSFPP